MGTRSYIARQIGDDQYLTIYCQLNGYPEDTGATLVKHYDTSEKVNALLALGDLYYLREKLSPDPGRHDFIAPQPGVTLAYRRDGDCPGWEATIKTFEELYDAADWAGIEYIYIYDTVFRDPVLQGSIDLKVYGEAQLEQQGYLLNTAETGYIRRNEQEFHHERTEPQPEFDMTM